MLKQAGCFLEIGKRGIWDKDRMTEARPDVRYEIIAIDSRMADDPAWVSGHLSQLSARVETGDTKVAPLVFEQFVSRLYLFHDDLIRPAGAGAPVPADLIAEVRTMAVESWAAERIPRDLALAGAQ